MVEGLPAVMAKAASETDLLARVGREIGLANDLLRRTESAVIEQSKEFSSELVASIQNFDRIAQFLADLETFVAFLASHCRTDIAVNAQREERWRKLSDVDNWVTCGFTEKSSDSSALF